MKLGKTRDSRTRRQPAKPVNVAEAEQLKAELQSQREFAQYLLLKGYSTSTTRRYAKDADMFIKWALHENIPLEQASYADVLHYIQGKRSTVKQRTVSSHLNSLKHYFNFLSLTHQQLENPTAQIQIKGIKRKTLYRVLSKTELESLYHRFEIPEESNHPGKGQNWFKASLLASKRNKVLLGLMVYQGMGSTELIRLSEKDLKLREGRIFIAGTRKSNERELKLEAHQVLDMMEYTLDTRKALLKLSGKESDRLFVSTGKGNGFHNSLQKLIAKLQRQNPKVTSFRQIRASVITQWLKTHNLRQVQYMAGHRYVSSTEAYLVNDLEDLQDEISKYHPIG